MNNKVFIFGAGASCENGVPLVRDVLCTALNDIEVKFREGEYSFGTYEEEKADEYYVRVFKLIDDIYDTNLLEVYKQNVKKEGLMVSNYDIKNADKFRFEEFLSRIDECINNNKNLKSYTVDLLKELTPYVHYIIFNTLSREADIESGALAIYKKFIRNRITINKEFYYFISFNYDTLLDRALSNVYFFESQNKRIPTPWSYGVNFGHVNSNFVSYNKKEENIKIYLLKPHGSFNWMYCNGCSETSLYYDMGYENCNYFNRKACPLCGNNDSALVLVPPTYFKKKSQLDILKNIYKKAEEALQKADEITIIGYSLPKEDVDIINLFKNNILDEKKPHITIVNESVSDMNKIENLLGSKNKKIEKIEKKFSEYV